MKKIYENALAEYQKAIKADPENAQAYLNMSMAYRGLNNGRNSILAARKAHDLFQKKGDAAKAVEVRAKLRELYKTYDIKPEEFK
ncbi:MAG: tetratricopeptide repeat protein [Nitrospinae bacterium]|nr:tetratricopeptide repeat protein [Nitrospinota bacterium]